MAGNAVLYAGGSILTQYTPLMNSGFTTVILNSLHVNSDGSLNLNDTPMVDSSGQATAAAQQLAQIVSDLKTHGGVQKVLVSVGGGGSFAPDPTGIDGWHSVSDGDFKNFSSYYWAATGMTSSLSNEIPMLESFATLLTTIGADGLDLDPEPMFYSYEAMASTTLLLTEWAMETQQGLATWVPFTAQQSWQAMALLLAADANPSPSWINLQPPAWDSGSDLKSWATNLGVGIAAIVPGFDGADPDAIQSALADLVNAGTAITGAYFWNYDQIVSGDVAQYATAIQEGLAGRTPPR